jgi:uncharacterized protein (DUF433 family)
MRITVGTILGLLAAGRSPKEDIQAALAYAAWRSEEIEVPLKAS